MKIAHCIVTHKGRPGLYVIIERGSLRYRAYVAAGPHMLDQAIRLRDEALAALGLPLHARPSNSGHQYICETAKWRHARPQRGFIVQVKGRVKKFFAYPCYPLRERALARALQYRNAMAGRVTPCAPSPAGSPTHTTQITHD